MELNQMLLTLAADLWWEPDALRHVWELPKDARSFRTNTKPIDYSCSLRSKILHIARCLHSTSSTHSYPATVPSSQFSSTSIVLSSWLSPGSSFSCILLQPFLPDTFSPPNSLAQGQTYHPISHGEGLSHHLSITITLLPQHLLTWAFAFICRSNQTLFQMAWYLTSSSSSQILALART